MQGCKMPQTKKTKKIFAIMASDRKQTSNLNVNSPAPETYSTAPNFLEAVKILKEKKQFYNHVKMKAVTP